MTDQSERTGAVPAQSTNPDDGGPWAEYLAAAQALDVVRRAASLAAGEQAGTLEAARRELDGVRARLAPQRARLVRDFGVPDHDLTPGPAEQAVAQQAVLGGPAAVLAALHQARATADAADHSFVGPPPSGPARPWVRNLLIYGAFAAVVLLVQVLLFLVAPPGAPPKAILVCGLSMPLLAFGLGWATIGFVYGDGPGKVDRTPIVGVLACLTPVVLTCMGEGLQALFN